MAAHAPDGSTAGGSKLGSRDVSKFALYIAIIALCLAALLYMLMHAKPSVAPAVKDSTGGHSSVVFPSRVPAEASSAYTVAFNPAYRG